MERRERGGRVTAESGRVDIMMASAESSPAHGLCRSKWDHTCQLVAFPAVQPSATAKLNTAEARRIHVTVNNGTGSWCLVHEALKNYKLT